MLRALVAVWTLVLAAAAPALAQAYVPSVKIGTAALIAPTAADTYYGSGTTSTNGLGATVRPPEIVELARALKNNPDLIYEYVRNNIEVVWVYGLQKGALGTSIDKAGTAYDQAMLMVELLRQAGHTASYKQGTITLTGAQFTAWSGISDATAACQMLAAGGIPAAINGTTSATCAYGAGTAITSVQLAHVWVSVTISGSSYVFDPAYKPHTWKTGINLPAAAGLTAGQPLSQATGGMTTGTLSGANYVRSLNMTALSSTLQTYATNLLAYINANNLAAAEIEDIIGGGKIQAYTSPSGGLRQTTLPYTSSALRTWSGGIPDQYRTTMRLLANTLNHDALFQGQNVYDTMFDRTFFVDEIYGRRLTLDTDFKWGAILNVGDYTNSKVFLKLDDVTLNTFTILAHPTPGSPQYSARDSTVYVQLTANHPYASAADGSATANGTYMDASVTKWIQLITGALIAHSWGDTGPTLQTKWADERGSDTPLPRPLFLPLACNGEPCWSTYPQSASDFTRQKMGASWLGQFARALRLHAAIAKAVPQHHHTLGVVWADSFFMPNVNTPHYLGGPVTSEFNVEFSVADNFDRFDLDTAISLTSKTANAIDRRAGLHAIAATAAALEGATGAQTLDTPDSSSTATRFEWGNAPPASEDPSGAGSRKVFEFNSGNVSAAGSLMLAENATAADPNSIYPSGYSSQPILRADEIAMRRLAAAGTITAYANAGFSVVASQETFLGPGQRGGAMSVQTITGGGVIDQVYFHVPSKQRGGALVATKYVGGEPVEIAHILTSDTGLTKGGGGGDDPEAKGKYDPAQAADVLKARFVDRSGALGITLNNGQLTYASPASLSTGSGKFPYALSASLSWRAGMPAPQTFGPSPASQPQPGWVTNWHNNLSVSGSGLEAMGQSDVRAAAGTIAAFLGAQDIYRASPSTEREVAGVLAQAWWVKGLSGNVVTVAVGADTRQFVKLADGTYTSTGGGPRSTLTWTGTRVPYEERCTDGSAPPPYALTRGWDYSNVSFAITNAGGDVQNFGFWSQRHWNGMTFCGLAKGFHLNTWTFPYGVSVALTYQNDFTDRILEVSNSLGRKLRYSYSTTTLKLASIDDGLTPSRSIAIGQNSGEYHASSHTDATGAVTSFKYTSAPANARPVLYYLLEKVFTADNATKPNVQYTYDGLGRVKEVRDAVALQWENRGPYQFFIADGTRGERVDPAGGAFAVTYDTDGRAWRYADEIGRRTEAFYDGRGRVVRYVYPELDEELIDYDERNNPIKLTKKVKPSSCTPTCLPDQVIEAAYHTTWNKPLWVKDQLGRQSDFTYFETGNGKSLIATALRPAVAGTRPQYSFTYDPRGQLLTATDPTGLVVQNTYDNSFMPGGDGQPVTTTPSATYGYLLSTTVDPGTSPHIASTTVYQYDATGNVTQTTDPRGNIVTTTYNANRQKLLVKSYLGSSTAVPVGTATQTTYDAIGRVIKEERATAMSSGTVAAWGSVTQVAYTPTGQKMQVTDADNRVTRMEYDAADRLSVSIDAENRRVRKVYDLAGQVLQELRADASPLAQVYAEYGYTANGKQAFVKDAKGNQTSYSYDGFDRLARTTMPDATYEDLSYDAMGNVTAKLTRGGQLIVNTYDSLDRMVTHLVPQPAGAPAILTTTAYDLAGRTTGISDNTGHSLAYAFDSAKRPISVTQSAPTFAGTRTVAYQLDLAGNKTRTTWADGYFVQYAYDAMGRMTTATENGTFVLATYVYDPLSRRTSLVYGNGTAQGYTYSTQGDLLTLANTLSGTANTYTNTFTKAHQLASETASNTAWSYVPATFQTTAYSAANNLNQYVNITVGANPTATMAYDANGNLTGDGVWTNTYDAQNMMRTTTGAGGTVTNVYDPLGRRQAIVENSVTTSFLHDGDEEIADYSGANALLRRYIPGPGTDMPVAMVTPNGGSNTRNYFHTNRQGSTIAMSADNGSLSEGPYKYDAYGNGAPTTGVPFKYTGRRLDAVTGYYYYRARFYLPGVGRFAQVDPIGYGDQMNLYAYVGNDPTNNADPSGLDTVIELRGYRLGNYPVVGGSYGHTYVHATDTETGNSVVFSSGPSGNLTNVQGALNSPGVDDNGNPITLQARVDSGINSPELVVGGGESKFGPSTVVQSTTVATPLDEVHTQLESVATKINDTQAPYQSQSRNSNTAAAQAYERTTGEDVKPTWQYPGIDQPLTDPPLPDFDICKAQPGAC